MKKKLFILFVIFVFNIFIAKDIDIFHTIVSPHGIWKFIKHPYNSNPALIENSSSDISDDINGLCYKNMPYDEDLKKRFTITAIHKRLNAQYKALLQYNNRIYMVVRGDSIDGGIIDRILSDKIVFQINGKYREYYLGI